MIPIPEPDPTRSWKTLPVSPWLPWISSMNEYHTNFVTVTFWLKSKLGINARLINLLQHNQTDCFLRKSFHNWPPREINQKCYIATSVNLKAVLSNFKTICKPFSNQHIQRIGLNCSNQYISNNQHPLVIPPAGLNYPFFYFEKMLSLIKGHKCWKYIVMTRAQYLLIILIVHLCWTYQQGI